MRFGASACMVSQGGIDEDCSEDCQPTNYPRCAASRFDATPLRHTGHLVEPPSKTSGRKPPPLTQSIASAPLAALRVSIDNTRRALGPRSSVQCDAKRDPFPLRLSYSACRDKQRRSDSGVAVAPREARGFARNSTPDSVGEPAGISGRQSHRIVKCSGGLPRPETVSTRSQQGTPVLLSDAAISAMERPGAVIGYRLFGVREYALAAAADASMRLLRLDLYISADTQTTPMSHLIRGQPTL